MTTDFIRDMDTTLLQLNSKDVFSLRTAYEGIFVLGGIGSGKTSGAGRAIAGAMLRSGAGGLVMVAKPEEIELWQSYAKQHGRTDDLVLFNEKAGCNFIAYEFSRKGVQGANSVTDCIMRILDAAEKAAGQGAGKDSDPFWKNTSRQMLLYSISALYGATGNVTVEDIVRFVTTAPTKRPTTPEELQEVEKSFAFRTLKQFDTEPVCEVPADVKKAVNSYWALQYTALAEKTRSSILIHVTSSLNRFATGMLRKCFCDETTIVPEMSFAGKIILLGLPILTMNEEAIVGQQLFQFLWMRAVESRNGLGKQFSERPLFLYGDECQYFVTPYWDTFLSTCRGSRCAVIAMSQSLPTLYAQIGQDKSDFVDGLTGKFLTKLFFLNSCPRSNKWASELIGKGLKIRKTQTQGVTTGMNTNRGGSQASTNEGWHKSEGTNTGTSEQEYEASLLDTNYFSTSLKTGGPKNNFEVSGVWFRAGAQFFEPIPNTSSNVVLATFIQQ
ncbi:MAG: type IV secretory system conjugative DNA transfer family protein [Nitrospira sp.]|nr:type IV secretory system conjugative DNA transfer family protein [Nitrospira sp.]